MLLRPSRTTRSSGFARSCAASFCRSAIGCSMPPQPYSQIRCRTRGIAEMVDERERVGPVLLERRVEDDPVRVLRVAPGVLQRDARPVGDPVDGDLRDAEPASHRVDVGRDVGRRVERPPRAQLTRAGRGRRDLRGGEGLLVGAAADQARPAGAARVERDEVAAGATRCELVGEVGGERDRRLPGAARERQDRRARRLAGADDPDVQRDAAGHLAGAVQRHRHRPALHAPRARRRPLGRGRGRRAHEQGGEGERDGKEAAHSEEPGTRGHGDGAVAHLQRTGHR